MPEKISEVLAEALELAQSLGATPLNKHHGCWEAQLDEHWWIAINAHRVPIKCSKDAMVPPFTMYIDFNGWPAGFVDPHGGTMAAGSLANEETLLAAIKEAQRRIA